MYPAKHDCRMMSAVCLAKTYSVSLVVNRTHGLSAAGHCLHSSKKFSVSSI